MKVGINVSDIPVADVLDYAKRADDRGLDSMWVGETWGWEAAGLLGAIARETDAVELGTGIVPVYSRSPALLGQFAATIGELSNDRFTLGIGASGPAVIENWHGSEFEQPIGYTAETIAIVRSVLSGETVSHDGDHFSLDGFRFRMEQDVTVPILVGAIGESNVRMAGALADGWMPIFMPRSRIAELQSEFYDSARSRDRNADELRVAPNTVVAVHEDESVAREAVKHHIAFYVAAMGDFYHRMLVDAGFEETADHIRQTWHQDGPDAAIDAVTDEVLEQATVTGTPSQAKEQLDRYDELGVDEFHGFFPRRADAEIRETTIDTFGEYVSVR